LASYCYNHESSRKRTSVINYKWTAFPEKAAVLDLERSKLGNIRDLFWQTDTSVASNAWGFIENIKYKPINRVIDDFIDIVSKNGCLLLNVCPKKDGAIPEEQQQMLRDLGAWLKVNGEAVYGSTPFKIYGEGPTGTVVGHVSEPKNKPFGSEDYRFTMQGEILYAFVLEKPKDSVASIKSLKANNELLTSKIKSVELLGSSETLKWVVDDDALKVTLPAEMPTQFAHVLKLQFEE